MVPTKWPFDKVIQTHTGKDGLVRVVTIKTATGTYKRPVTKIALLLPSDSPLMFEFTLIRPSGLGRRYGAAADLCWTHAHSCWIAPTFVHLHG